MEAIESNYFFIFSFQFLIENFLYLLKKPTKNATLQNSLDNALSEVAVADCVKEDLFELDRQRNALEDEKKTLESLLTETRDEVTSTRTRYEHECARMKAVNEQLELENRELKIHHSKAKLRF